MMKRCYQVILNRETSEALAKEAKKETLLPSKLIEQVVRDWLVGRGNLSIHEGKG